MTSRRRDFGLWAGLVVVVVGLVAIAIFVRDRSVSTRSSRADSDSSVLALTWGPSLCQVQAAVRGCQNGNVAKMGPSFVLHGLWPQPSTMRYCGVPEAAADRRSPPELPPQLRARLAAIMSDSTSMAPHEWFAHGTCSGVSPNEYFSIAAALSDDAVAVLDRVFNDARGRRLSSRTVRQAVDAAFGDGTGNRVSLTCRPAGTNGDVVYEVRLSLPAVASLRSAGGPPALSDALARGPVVQPGCGQGRVP